jgi:hypothetical protein
MLASLLISPLRSLCCVIHVQLTNCCVTGGGIYLYLYGCILKRPPVRPRRLFHCSPSHRTLFLATVSDHETLFIPVNNSNGSRTLFITGTEQCWITQPPVMNSTYRVRHCTTDLLLFRTFSFPLLCFLKKKTRPCKRTGTLLVSDVVLDQMPKVLQYYTSHLKYKFM